MYGLSIISIFTESKNTIIFLALKTIYGQDMYPACTGKFSWLVSEPAGQITRFVINPILIAITTIASF